MGWTAPRTVTLVALRLGPAAPGAGIAAGRGGEAIEEGGRTERAADRFRSPERRDRLGRDRRIQKVGEAAAAAVDERRDADEAVPAFAKRPCEKRPRGRLRLLGLYVRAAIRPRRRALSGRASLDEEPDADQRQDQRPAATLRDGRVAASARQTEPPSRRLVDVLRLRNPERRLSETIDVDQTILGRLLGYGPVLIRGVGSSWEPLRRVASPLELRNAIIVG